MSCECKDAILGKVGVSRRTIFGTFGDPKTTIVAPPAAALAAGDVVSELLTFDCVANRAADSARIVGAQIYETADSGGYIGAELDLILFDEAITPAAADSPFAVPAEIESIVDVIQFDAASYVQLDAANALARVDLIEVGVKLPAEETNLYGVLVAPSGVTYAANGELRVKLIVERD